MNHRNEHQYAPRCPTAPPIPTHELSGDSELLTHKQGPLGGWAGRGSEGRGGPGGRVRPDGWAVPGAVSGRLNPPFSPGGGSTGRVVLVPLTWDYA